jgi:hypothetical protein
MAGSIEEVRALAEKLDKGDGTQFARTLGQRMINAIPRFEVTLDKRQRREYRQARRAAFTRPEPGFSLYEGRTRGKRMRYNYDDDEGQDDSDATSNRRSARHSERNTPVATGPTYTASGRQVRPRQGGEYGASLLSGQANGADGSGVGYDSEEPVRGGRRATRGTTNGHNGKRKRLDDEDDDGEMSDEEADQQSEDGWNSEANGADEDELPDADDEDDGRDEEEAEEPQSLVVKLKLKKGSANGDTRSSEPPRMEPEPNPLSATTAPTMDDSTESGAATIASGTATAAIANGSHTPSTESHAHDSKSGYPTPASLAPTAMLLPQQRSMLSERV